MSRDLEVHTIGPHTMSLYNIVNGVHNIQYKENANSTNETAKSL